MSEYPTVTHCKIRGFNINNKVPKKLRIKLKRIFKRKYNPIAPKINKIPSKRNMTDSETYPKIKNKPVKNDRNGGLDKS
ncbi:MAG: hypothetical protein Kow0019_07890 [Methanobacteriaceae archaeon]